MSSEQPPFDVGNDTADSLRFGPSKIEKLCTKPVNFVRMLLPVLDVLLQEDVRRALMPFRRAQHFYRLRAGLQSEFREFASHRLERDVTPDLASLLLHFFNRFREALDRILKSRDRGNGIRKCRDCHPNGRRISLKRFKCMAHHCTICSHALNHDLFVVQSCCAQFEAFEEDVVVLLDQLIKLSSHRFERLVSGEQRNQRSDKRSQRADNRAQKTEPLVWRRSMPCLPNRTNNAGPSSECKCEADRRSGEQSSKSIKIHADKLPRVRSFVERVAA